MEISVEKPQQPETSELVEQAAEISQVFLADDADDDEEEVEPKLKYERLSNDIAHILKIDASSCIAVHPKVLPKLKSKSKHFCDFINTMNFYFGQIFSEFCVK